MKIIIIALFISFALSADVALTGAADSTDACKYDVSAAQASGATANDTDTVFAVLATCATAPTSGAVADLKTAGCSFLGLKATANATSYTIAKTAALTNTTVASTHDQTTYTAITGCTAAAALATGTTICKAVATLTADTKYYWSADTVAAGTTTLATFTAVTNGCTDSSDSSIISMSFAALASVF